LRSSSRLRRRQLGDVGIDLPAERSAAVSGLVVELDEFLSECTVLAQISGETVWSAISRSARILVVVAIDRLRRADEDGPRRCGQQNIESMRPCHAVFT